MPTHGSCLPVTSISTSLPSLSIVLPFVLMLDVGLIIKLRLISSPLDIPPNIPPELFDEKPDFVISSLASEPFRLSRSSTLPTDTDFTALIVIIAFAKFASSFSKTGSPKPTGQFLTITPNFAPTELPSLIKLSNIESKSDSLDSSQKKYLLSISL